MGALAFRIGKTIGEYSGPGYLAGVITVAGVPAQRWMQVYSRTTTRMIASRFSATDGSFRIDGLDPHLIFDVRALDWSEDYKDATENTIHPWPYAGSPPSYPHGDYVPPDGNDISLNLDTYVPQSSMVPYAIWTA